MYQPTEELLKEVMRFPAVKEMKATVNNSIKSGLVVGAATMLSGILGGPRGMVLGGIVSSCTAGYLFKDSFRSVPEILSNDITPEQKDKLAKLIREFLSTQNIAKVQDILHSCDKETMIQGVIQIIAMFLASELHMSPMEIQ